MTTTTTKILTVTFRNPMQIRKRKGQNATRLLPRSSEPLLAAKSPRGIGIEVKRWEESRPWNKLQELRCENETMENYACRITFNTMWHQLIHVLFQNSKCVNAKNEYGDKFITGSLCSGSLSILDHVVSILAIVVNVIRWLLFRNL